MMKFLALLAVLGALLVPTFAQKMQTPAGEAPGPWILGTIGIGKQPDGTMNTTALKGIAIKVGEHGEASVAYDLDLCRMAGAWTGKFTTPMNLMSRGEYPTAMGEVAFTTGEVPGLVFGNFTTEGATGLKEQEQRNGTSGLRAVPSLRDFRDSRAEPFGPLPVGQARFKGFHVHEEKVILQWEIGGTTVLEMPEYRRTNDDSAFIRNFTVPAGGKPFRIVLCEGDGPAELAVTITTESASKELGHVWEQRLCIAEVPAAKEQQVFRFTIRKTEPGEDKFAALRASQQLHPGPLIDLSRLLNGSPARWPESIVTEGELSKDTASAYVVDTIKLPDPNPWGAPMFVGGFDFFPDGRAAVCTFHGDVFVVDGFNDERWKTGVPPVAAGADAEPAGQAGRLPSFRWRRFATGLYHALGLKIVNGEIYVTCRDGIWRLKDLNGDGEADFYEAFNFDVKLTKSFHEFVFDLQTDPAGNFYFAKAGPVKNGGRGFDPIMAHHGSLFRVSPDGGKFEVVATGFRAPNGIGVGPHGELTSGDNEGTWTPVCKINWIKPGGFYGVVPLAHRDPLPTSYDPPLCWLPKRVDNSGGSQVWAPDGERWGPWGGKMLHLSYGQAALYGVMVEGVSLPADPRLSTLNPQLSTLHQGGVTKFPLQFQSGIMRARFNPKDGQLYVAGLRGWQTSGLKNGCFQRVRYTGGVPRMPIEMQVKKEGIELRFTCSIDTQSARDVENWQLEQWRYLWSSAYGSPELSTETDPEAPAEAGKDGAAQFTKAQMSVAKHDSVTVKSVTIGTDDRTVFLEIPGLKPVMQMSIKYDLKSADGKDLRGEVVNTIHALGRE